MRDHGTDTPVSVGNIVDGIASVPITVGEGQQPLDELVNPNLDAGRHGPCGDAYDNLVVDFGFTPLYTRFADVATALDAIEALLASGAWREPRFQRKGKVT